MNEDDYWKILEGTIYTQYGIDVVNRITPCYGDVTGDKQKAASVWEQEGNGTDDYETLCFSNWPQEFCER